MKNKNLSILEYSDDQMHCQLRLCYDAGLVDENLKDKYKQIYKGWYDMHYRCYSEKLHERYPTYIGCSVCDEWHDFNNFLEWYKENYYEIEGQKMDLDKDILVKGNKVYSPDTCIFVPHEINTIFVNGKKNRGEYPLGVSWDNSRNSFRAEARCKKLGRFKTAEQAFAAYKKEKEKQIKELAKKYKPYIPEKLYDAMVHWKIEITD
ncbi:MAG: hypothetical protein WBI07_13425 [Mobilitalea sp.]